MNWRNFRILLYFVVAAVILSIVGWIVLSPTITWFAPVVALGLVSIGLGVNSLVLVNHTDKKIEAISGTLKSIKQIQEAIQKEQSASHSPIIPTLQALSQLYLDYLGKQQSGEEQQENTNDT